MLYCEPGELGHYPAQQYRLGRLVDRMDEDKEPVTTIDERVIVTGQTSAERSAWPNSW